MHEARVALWFVPHHNAPTRHPVNCREACAVDHSERFVVTAVTCAVRAAASEILNTWLRRSAVRRTSAYPAPQAGSDPRREHVINSDDVFVSGTISGSRKRRGNGMLFWPTKHPRGTRWIRRAAGQDIRAGRRLRRLPQRPELKEYHDDGT